jgi:hypothetical protein
MYQLPQLPWIEVARSAPYFVTDRGEPWTPVGHNDAITWPALHGIYRQKDLNSVDEYLGRLARRGVTVLRLMLEYCEGDNRYFEQPAGRFNSHMIQLWDDLFALAGRHGLRVLLTPFDTFWMWIRWNRHPYNRANGGPCPDRSRLLLCPETRNLIKTRLEFVSDRWGSSGVIFAWDLYNEIHPSHAENSAECFAEFITDIGSSLRRFETRVHGRAHPQTVSVFGPHMVLDTRIKDAIFRHPCLDFSSTHFYEEGTIDYPRNSVDPALATGRLMREALAEVPPCRPFFDSEHGPIHTFKDHHTTLPEPFDDEYFRHMQWAHFASGGAGGGMRWPNRKIHILTKGMHVAQQGLARFLALIEWACFRRRNLNEEVRVEGPFARFACGDANQAVVWLLRTDTIGRDGRLNRRAEPAAARLAIPGLAPGCYHVTAWDTAIGVPRMEFQVSHDGSDYLRLQTPGIVRDLALAIRS